MKPTRTLGLESLAVQSFETVDAANGCICDVAPCICTRAPDCTAA